MFKRALGKDAHAVKAREMVEADTILTDTQKRRVLNSLLSLAVLSTEELNELEHLSDDDERFEFSSDDEDNKKPKQPTKEEEIVRINSLAKESESMIFASGQGSFKACKFCPGKRMLTDDDVTKHLASKQHIKKADGYVEPATASVPEATEAVVAQVKHEKLPKVSKSGKVKVESPRNTIKKTDEEDIDDLFNEPKPVKKQKKNH